MIKNVPENRIVVRSLTIYLAARIYLVFRIYPLFILFAFFVLIFFEHFAQRSLLLNEGVVFWIPFQLILNAVKLTQI